MTVKEFSAKYRIPYNIVYQATYEVKPVYAEEKAKHYDENKLRDAVSDILYGMWTRSQKNANRYKEYRHNLNIF